MPELEVSGYSVQTHYNISTEKLSKVARGEQIFLLTLKQSKSDGIEVCSVLRAENPTAYIAIISEAVESYVKVAAIEAGADDYFETPFNKRLIIAKINAWQGRLLLAQPKPEPNSEYDGLRINRASYSVFVNDKLCEVPKKEFEILSLLVTEPRRVFTREQIKRTIWDLEAEVRDRTIDVHIKKLRERIGRRYIKTIRGVGYKLGA